MRKSLSALVFATGGGAGFKSATPKVLDPLLGTSMLRLVLESVLNLKPDRLFLVVGSQQGAIPAEVTSLPVAIIPVGYRTDRSSGLRALGQALKRPAVADVLVLSADLPLLRPESLRALIEFHRRRRNTVTLMRAGIDDPVGLGRADSGQKGRIRLKPGEGQTSLAQSRGPAFPISVFDRSELMRTLAARSSPKAKAMLSLADLLAVLGRPLGRIGAFKAPFPEEIVPVTNLHEFGLAANALRDRKIRTLEASGVTVFNSASTWIDLAVEIGPKTIIYPSVVIEGKTAIGSRCRIYPGAHIIGSQIGDGVKILSWSVVEGAVVEDGASVGPFARLRPKTVVQAGARVGNFVEMKNVRFGRGSKAGHLSYLGDCEVHEGVNIGAGTVTCNFDGFRKNKTVIEADAFVGSGTELIAPVRVGKGAYVGAGSVITKDVSAGALAVSRVRQMEKSGWAERKRERLRKDAENK
jgi:bifunctional UDP-N-acetylglucosamine pyrophosphorylase/glucosamine-1-phosphate N-acetyltransferase